MFVPDASPHPATSPRERIEAQQVLLDRLAGLAMEFAEAAGRRGRAAFDDPEQAEAEYQAGLDFERAARSARLCIALQARLAQDLPAIEKAERLGDIYRTGEVKASIHHRVGRAILADRDHAPQIKALAAGVRARVENDYEAEDLLRRPVAQIVARICKDLGLSPEATAAALDPFAGADDADIGDEDADPPDDPGPAEPGPTPHRAVAFPGHEPVTVPRPSG